MQLPKEPRTEIPYVVPITYKQLKKNYKSLVAPPLSDKAKALGQIFYNISIGEMQPKGAGGVLMDGDNCMAFRGTGPHDMADVYHFLVIPKNVPYLESIHDLEYTNLEHRKMIDRMVTFAYSFCIQHKLCDNHPITMGFHNDPTVGYLHMHVLVGHLTDFGYRERHRWISVNDVFDQNPNPFHQMTSDICRFLVA